MEELDDDTPASLAAKEEHYRQIVESSGYDNACLLHDTWCAAFVWPKISTDYGTELTTEHLRKIEKNPHSVSANMKAQVRSLARQYRFFHWHLEFPLVFRSDGGGGFDCILGNPPWERIQVEEKQFFSSVRPDIAAARSKDRQKLIDALKDEDPSLLLNWQETYRIGNGQSHLIKCGGCYPHSGKGNVNTFALFAELSARIINKSGLLGLILPSGVITEASNEDLFRSWLEDRRLVCGFDFENSSGIFPDVHRSFRFCLLTLCGIKAGPERPSFRFFLSNVDELQDTDKLLLLGKNEIQLLNPSSLTCPPIRSRKDADLLLNAHNKFGIFVSGDTLSLNPWSADSRQMLNSSHDSASFVEFPLDTIVNMDMCGLIDGEQQSMLRLYDGKMVDQFDHRLASTGHNQTTLFRTTSSERTSPNEYVRPDFLVTPQYWVSMSKVSSLVPEFCLKRGWWLAFRAVTASTNWRTLIATAIPLCGQVHSLPALYSPLSAFDNAALLACLNSFVLDYCARLKLSGTHMSHFVFKQLPVPAPLVFMQPTPWSDDKQMLKEWLLPRTLELTYTAWDLQPFAKDSGFDGPPFIWDEDRRFQLRCELDAAFFHLYGISRDDVDYIMETFPIVKRKNEAQYGSYRTKETILTLYDALADAQRTGQPFVSALDPPPADPRCCHPPKLE